MEENLTENIVIMETVVIKANTKSDANRLLDFSRQIGAVARIIDTDELADARLAALIEEGLKTPSVSRAEIMNHLK